MEGLLIMLFKIKHRDSVPIGVLICTSIMSLFGAILGVILK